jgi:hypothetical protein
MPVFGHHAPLPPPAPMIELEPIFPVPPPEPQLEPDPAHLVMPDVELMEEPVIEPMEDVEAVVEADLEADVEAEFEGGVEADVGADLEADVGAELEADVGAEFEPDDRYIHDSQIYNLHVSDLENNTSTGKWLRFLFDLKKILFSDLCSFPKATSGSLRRLFGTQRDHARRLRLCRAVSLHFLCLVFSSHEMVGLSCV